MPGISDLMRAIADGDVPQVKRLIGELPELASAGASGGESPVLAALYRGEDEILAVLRAAAALTVHEAAALGDIERLDTILRADPSYVEAYSHDGWTPLHLAAYFGRAYVAERLLVAAADVCAVSKNDLRNTPLHAALAGRVDWAVVDRLLSAGADADAAAEQGFRPVHLAASRGAAALVDRLLAEGANAAARTEDGKSAADFARESDHEALAERLESIM